jgi:hypothetical protein
MHTCPKVFNNSKLKSQGSIIWEENFFVLLLIEGLRILKREELSLHAKKTVCCSFCQKYGLWTTNSHLSPSYVQSCLNDSAETQLEKQTNQWPKTLLLNQFNTALSEEMGPASLTKVKMNPPQGNLALISHAGSLL